MEITKNECYQCLYECMEESLPKGWKTAWVDAEIQGDEINVSYFYTSGIFRKKSKFLTKNTFAPPNAMNAIHDIMRNEGNPWSMAQLKFTRMVRLSLSELLSIKFLISLLFFGDDLKGLI